MSSNDITGDRLISKATNDKFRTNYDAIFGKKTRGHENNAESNPVEEKVDNNNDKATS